MAEELKPCPFCGGEAYLTPSGVIAYCSNTKECDATVNPQRGQREAIAVWNRRPAQPTLRKSQDRIAELEAALERAREALSRVLCQFQTKLSIGSIDNVVQARIYSTTKDELMEVLASLPAPRPSPAPVESKPI